MSCCSQSIKQWSKRFFFFNLWGIFFYINTIKYNKSINKFFHLLLKKCKTCMTTWLLWWIQCHETSSSVTSRLKDLLVHKTFHRSQMPKILMQMWRYSLCHFSLGYQANCLHPLWMCLQCGINFMIYCRAVCSGFPKGLLGFPTREILYVLMCKQCRYFADLVSSETAARRPKHDTLRVLVHFRVSV